LGAFEVGLTNMDARLKVHFHFKLLSDYMKIINWLKLNWRAC